MSTEMMDLMVEYFFVVKDGRRRNAPTRNEIPPSLSLRQVHPKPCMYDVIRASEKRLARAV